MLECCKWDEMRDGGGRGRTWGKSESISKFDPEAAAILFDYILAVFGKSGFSTAINVYVEPD